MLIIFADKIRKIQNALKSALAGTVYDSFSFDVFYSNHKLTSLSTVTPAKVYKLISGMIAKYSSFDSIPTSLIKACPAVFSELVAHLANSQKVVFQIVSSEHK